MNEDISVECLPGLSGGSYKYRQAGRSWVLRRAPSIAFPAVSRKREYRLLCKLRHSGITVPPQSLSKEGLIQPWILGKSLDPAEFYHENRQLIELLSVLYQQPLSGYPLVISKILLRYWQLCEAKSYSAFKLLQRLLNRGLPRPIRTVLLHMDLHAGNIIQHQHQLLLIDWEYAGDGDIGLELATLCWQQPLFAEQWLSLYAKQWNIPESLLQGQIRRWYPWVGLLQCFWYQLRYQQTGEAQFQQLATESLQKSYREL
jgi:thiamine kinase